MNYAYIRVSTTDQNTARQLEAVKNYCPALSDENIFLDKASGKDFDRKEYQRLKEALRPGDELIVKELDRLGRNKDAIKQEFEWFRLKHIRVRILNIRTTLVELPEANDWVFDMINNILFEVYSSIAEEERQKIRRRQAEGIALAKKQGKYQGDNHKGRQRVEYDTDLFKTLYIQHRAGLLSAEQFRQQLGLSKSTLYRRIGEFELQHSTAPNSKIGHEITFARAVSIHTPRGA